MNTENKELMKHFASILRKRANEEKEPQRKINPSILYLLSRRDIVAIVGEMYKGNVPGNPDLAVLENNELLRLIPDDLFIISHVLNGWCQKLLEVQETEQSTEHEEGSEYED